MFSKWILVNGCMKHIHKMNRPNEHGSVYEVNYLVE
jgi:hypothetical protein